MAREVVIEISWIRPLKLIGLANLFCALIAFIISMILKDWVSTDESESKVNDILVFFNTRLIFDFDV